MPPSPFATERSRSNLRIFYSLAIALGAIQRNCTTVEWHLKQWPSSYRSILFRGICWVHRSRSPLFANSICRSQPTAMRLSHRGSARWVDSISLPNVLDRVVSQWTLQSRFEGTSHLPQTIKPKVALLACCSHASSRCWTSISLVKHGELY